MPPGVRGFQNGNKAACNKRKLPPECVAKGINFAPEAFDILISIAKSTRNKANSRIAAITEIFDRIYGKSEQFIEQDINLDNEQIKNVGDSLNEFAKCILDRLPKQGADGGRESNSGKDSPQESVPGQT